MPSDEIQANIQRLSFSYIATRNRLAIICYALYNIVKHNKHVLQIDLTFKVIFQSKKFAKRKH